MSKSKQSEQDEAVAAVERAMVAIRRSQTRRSLARQSPPEGERPIDPTLFGVLDVIEGCARACSVTDVAVSLAVDQPRASRLVQRAVADGLVDREVDPADARRTLLTLSGEGQRQLDLVHRRRRQVFARAMEDWPDADRVAFARLITAFVADFAAQLSGGD
ncbi:MarR family transcriptional regulator [Kitasatospora acidiphila]|uniref:MarR family transcriptional regulator n=1 Tax=Kitasatospora acidiphila TaxID=2567942 RepID=A0A540WAW5_9ACTN|nr:MarR family transcriptional regulator [Kitasatospora acidiphila]TQF06146.1 MarR family transcriptional regulator [Kitasatospora acidiphila]